jgi:hypothetical protein
MTNFTNEQLEAWAGLGPWLKQYSPTIDAMQIIEPVERDSEGNVPIPRKIAHVYEGQRMDMDRIKLHSDALASAPALASALLAERKARKVEVGELKRLLGVWTGQDDRFQPMLAGNPSAIDDFMAECAEAMKGN